VATSPQLSELVTCRYGHAEYHYCVAKGSKHIRAALILVDHGFPEDAIVLSSAAYECYVSAAYAKAQGVQALDDLVYNTVGLNAGTVEYARTKTGGWDYRRLVDKETGTFYDAPPSIEKMIRNTGYPADALVHRRYYGFSSEHAHVNMAGSGNYREGARYTDRGNAQKPNAVFLTAYVTVTLLGTATISATLQWDLAITTDHNHVESEPHSGSTFWVHRKGAMAAAQDQEGALPGSMGTASFHVQGRGCPEALCSSAHGAGRLMSRTAARRSVTTHELQRQMAGIWYDMKCDTAKYSRLNSCAAVDLVGREASCRIVGRLW
jgi:hypothetical protein